MLGRLGILAFLSWSVSVGATVLHVNTDAELELALDKAEEGDEIVLHQGEYRGGFTIEESLTLRGEGKVVIRAPKKGSGIVVDSTDVTIENLTIRDFGRSLYDKDAGVRLKDRSSIVTLRRLDIEGPSFGVRADRLSDLTIENCRFAGESSMHTLDRGDGVYVKYVNNLKISHSRFEDVRDGVYMENTDATALWNNTFTRLQYGIHWMYTQNGQCWNNHAEDVVGGYAVMSTESTEVRSNTVRRAEEFGVLLNVAHRSRIHNNRIEGVHNPQGNKALDTEGKAIFVYGPGANVIERNVFSNSDIGIGVAMGGEGNHVFENSIRGNRTEVRYVGEKPLQWSHAQRGNYWGAYLGWDINRDGVGDRPYQPNDSLDRLFWIYPEAQFLMSSPVVALLRWLASEFQIDRGKGITDSYPLMQEPKIDCGEKSGCQS